jgi:hypothetical protein
MPVPTAAHRWNWTTAGNSLTYDRAVVAYLSAEPGLRQKIRQLSAAVGVAGARVRDAGLLTDSFDQNLRVYTSEEIWTFDPAIDVIALLGTLDGLPGGPAPRSPGLSGCSARTRAAIRGRRTSRTPARVRRPSANCVLGYPAAPR